jgi:hypothetical protein
MLAAMQAVKHTPKRTSIANAKQRLLPDPTTAAAAATRYAIHT